MKPQTWGLIIATGKGEQLSADIDTPFLYLNDRPVLAYSMAAFMQCQEVDGFVVVIDKERAESVLGMVQMLGFSKIKKIVAGGARRSTSMAAGLEHIDEDVEWVCVHDASRPLVTAEQICDTVKCAKRHGSGVLATPVIDHVVRAQRHVVEERMETIHQHWHVLSPQTYSREDLLKAYPLKAKNRKSYADDLEAIMDIGVTPRLVPTQDPTLRIRSADDLTPALDMMRWLS